MQRLQRLWPSIRSTLTTCTSISSSPVKAPGVLDQVLDSIAAYKERIESIKGKVKKAMFYPMTVIAVAIGVTALLLIVVIPQFEEIFQSFGADLPAFTRMVINASEFLQANFVWVGLFGRRWYLWNHSAEKAQQEIRSFSRSTVSEDPRNRSGLGEICTRALCQHPCNHICCRCSTSGCAENGGGRNGQYCLRRSRAQNPR